MSHAHSVHDLFKHIRTVYVTNLIVGYLNMSHPRVENLQEVTYTVSPFQFKNSTKSFFLREIIWAVQAR